MADPRLDPESEQALMDVMRQLNLAMALVADARDRGRPQEALAATIYLRAAAEALVKLNTRSVATT